MFDYYVSKLSEVTAFMQSSSFFTIEEVCAFVMASFGAGLGLGLGLTVVPYLLSKVLYWFIKSVTCRSKT